MTVVRKTRCLHVSVFGTRPYTFDMRLASLPLALTIVASCLAGCGSGYAFLPYVLPIFAGGTPAYALYHAYGDSITFGAFLADPATQAYPALVATATGLNPSNRGIPGDMACDVPTRQIFPAADAPALASNGLYSLLISTNDVGVKNAGPYEAVFNLCHRASIAWLAVPAEDKVLGTASTVKSSGAVSVETANHWNALTTQAAGASLTFPFTRAAAGPVYIWYRIRDGSPGQWTYALDGKALGSGTTATSPSIATQNGSSDSLALLRLDSIPAGAHTVTFVQTSAGATGVGIVAIGFPPSTTASQTSLVLVGTMPKQLSEANDICSVNPRACDAYIADITANVKLLASDGLNVELFDSRKYMLGTSLDMRDIVHPNARGHLEIAHSVLDALGVPETTPVDGGS